MYRKKIYTTISTFLFALTVFAQQEIPVPPVPASRQLHHELIMNSLTSITKLRRKTDTLFPFTGNIELDQSLNRTIRLRTNNLRAEVELNTALDDNAKFTWLRGINEMLTAFISSYRARAISPSVLPALLKAYEAGNSILPIISKNSIEVDNILIDNFALKNNAGVEPGKDVLVLKACQRNPDDILKILTKFPNNRYADSLIIKAAFRDQDQLYNYAAVPNELGKRIASVDNPLVKIISRLALSKTGRMYFPFLDNLYRGKVTMEQIAPLVKNDSTAAYYKLLVRTRIDYAGRMQHGDTPMAATVLTKRLKEKAIELYINEINALHDVANASVRFKKLEELSPEELYYLAVLGEEEIYTSSFVNGVYPKIFQKMSVPRSDSLLASLHYDYYKKFIKICAAYNTLDNFLSRMDVNTAQNMMRSFVNGLETASNLEDAVDVADSYASIYNKDLRKLILGQVKVNLEDATRKGNKKGQLIYTLMNTIFLSMDSTNKIDMTATLGIEPVYIMPRKSLEDSAGRVIIQQFSYGDKDARSYWPAFISKFTNANWKIVRKPEWVEISTTRGAPITIYANLPLDEKQELDVQAQENLISYLDEHDIAPRIVIHRGHSYYLQETINRLPSTAKVVLLGSCGGYQKLNDILKICPTAQIISSKQVAAGVLNQSIIDGITDRLRAGKDLNWEELWKTVEKKVGAGYRDKFDDYIPPHKNLGAIFIMAYDKAWRGDLAMRWLK
jgi:hypothetical protein